MSDRSKLLKMKIYNLGCIGPEGLEIWLDKIVCLVGRNNAGKSTILRAYELAQGGSALKPEDRCKWASEDAATQIVLDIHIPKGIGNVDEKWKVPTDGLLVVSNRWTWQKPDLKCVRSTWDPSANDGQGDWADEGKAGGADNVFKSRLPQPMRISSLQDATFAHSTLIALIIEPLAQQIAQSESDPDSEISKAMSNFLESVKTPLKNYQDKVTRVEQDVAEGLKQIFPNLDIRIDVKLDPFKYEIKKLLASGTCLRILDGEFETELSQQGTGAQRALFWTLVRVHNMLKRKEEEDKKKKSEEDKLDALIEKEKNKSKPNAAIITKLNLQKERLYSLKEGDSNDLVFPGYVLLIDEPENALHPLAARSAQKALYELAKDHDWQVMVTTHSPYFVNPFEDHTTIVRLERSSDHSNASIAPKTYRTVQATFSEDERQRLHVLQKMDTGLSEMFFGSYPILVEGDTENAAFIAAVLEDDPGLSEKIVIVKALGKATFVPLIRIFQHFKVDFGIVHDCDSPYNINAQKNGMWTINSQIFAALQECRQSGIIVRHRVSIPDFERRLGGGPINQDKPYAAYTRLKKDEKLRVEMRTLLMELFNSEQYFPIEKECNDVKEYEKMLREKVLIWAGRNGCSDDPRFCGKISDKPT
ncbi:MAG: AAA family ATPase [Magnetococcus sp. YQC-5]